MLEPMAPKNNAGNQAHGRENNFDELSKNNVEANREGNIACTTITNKKTSSIYPKKNQKKA